MCLFQKKMAYVLNKLQKLAKVQNQRVVVDSKDVRQEVLKVQSLYQQHWHHLECVRNVNSWASPQIYSHKLWLWGVGSDIYVLTSSQRTRIYPQSLRTTDRTDPLQSHFLTQQTPSSVALLLKAVILDKKCCYHPGACQKLQKSGLYTRHTESDPAFRKLSR